MWIRRVALAVLLVVAAKSSVSAQAGVRPILECVLNNGDGSYTAFFGHLNENPSAVTIPVGAANAFVPAPQDRGQTLDFPAGRSAFYPNAAFRVVWNGAANLVWTLTGPNGQTRTSTASNSPAQACATKLPDGASCSLGGQCTSGACQNGQCLAQGQPVPALGSAGGALLALALLLAAWWLSAGPSATRRFRRQA